MHPMSGNILYERRIDDMDFVPLIFRIEDEEYGIDINFVSGIEIISDVYPSVIKSDTIKETINYRGKKIPVFSLKNKFALIKRRDSDKLGCDQSEKIDVQAADEIRYIIVEIDNIQFAMKADYVEKIDMAGEKKLFDIPDIIRTEHTQCYDKILKVDERVIMILDIERLLTTEEKNQIANEINIIKKNY